MRLTSCVAVMAALWMAVPAQAEQEKAKGLPLGSDTVKMARYAKAYIGKGNVTVEVAPYTTSEKKEGALISISGVESDWDGKILNHVIIPGGRNGKIYQTTRPNGKTWNTLYVTPYPYGGGDEIELFVPKAEGGEIKVMLSLSDGASQAASTMAIYEKYQQQSKDK